MKTRRDRWIILTAALAWLCCCEAASAQVGKCCLPDGRGCRDVTESQCALFGGVFVPGQLCASPDDNCDAPLSGACCPTGGGGCTFGPISQCAGQFFPNAPCTPTTCVPPATGACCEDFQCRVTTPGDCPNGTFFPE